MNALKTQEDSQCTWIGIDVSSNSYDAAIYLPLEPGSAPRNILKLPAKHFKRTRESVAAFHEWTFRIRDNAGLPGGAIRVAMEATGRYSKELADWISEKIPCSKPVILNPKMVADYRKSLYPGNDTDAIAAGALARFGAERHPEPKDEWPEEYLELRELTRQRSHLVNQRTVATNRLREIKDINIVADVQKSIVQALDKAISKVELRIEQCIQKSEELSINTTYATSIKGIGIVAATTIFAECGPLERYSARQLGAYSGLSPFKHTSGTSINSTRISRKGPKQLRQALYTPTTSVLKYNSEMQSFRARLIARGLTPMQARCAVMRKTLILIRALVVNQTIYMENYKNIPEQD